MKGHRTRCKIFPILTSLIALASACTESTSPTLDAPFTLAVVSSGGMVRLIHSDGVIEGGFSCAPNCKYEIARWSRDGTLLSLEGTAVENGQSYSVLYTANADGSSPVRIDRSPAYCIVSGYTCQGVYYHQFDADWSTDGRLVYTLNDASVVVSSADGSGKQVLVSATEDVGQARWGPSDQTITFVSGVPAKLFSVRSADGSGLGAITNVVVDRYGWSPDGLSIAVKGPADPNLSESSLFLVHPVTGQATELLRYRMDLGFSWSPQSNEIAFTNYQTDSLFVLDRNGTVTPIFQGDVGAPQWSPDGRYLIATGSGVDQNAVSAISRSTGSRRIIANIGSLDRFSVKNSTLYNGFYVYFP